jgi:hypothetical protein
MLAARDGVASPTHLHWHADSAAQAELAALQTKRLQVAMAAAAVDTEAVASDAAYAISWSAGAASGAVADVAVATLQVELRLVERDAARAAGAVERAASIVAELVAHEEEPATLLVAAAELRAAAARPSTPATPATPSRRTGASAASAP